jgi:hypothetical protein
MAKPYGSSRLTTRFVGNLRHGGRVIETLPVEAFLEAYPDPIREAAERLRAIVHAAVPEAIERVRPGWRLIGYDIPVGRQTRYFAWIWPEGVHVHLGFEHGVLMDDPGGVLHGAHLRLKKVRYFTYAEPGEIDAAQAIAFLREAARIATLPRGERRVLALDRETETPPD